MDRDSRWLATSARILFWAALLFAFVMATLPQPPLVVATSDKVQHMLAFAALTLLMGLGWPRLALWRILVAMALIPRLGWQAVYWLAAIPLFFVPFM